MILAIARVPHTDLVDRRPGTKCTSSSAEYVRRSMPASVIVSVIQTLLGDGQGKTISEGYNGMKSRDERPNQSAHHVVDLFTALWRISMGFTDI